MTSVDAPPPTPHMPTRLHFLFVHKRLIRFSAFVRCILLHLCLFGESLWSKSVPSATQILQFTRYTYRSVAMQMQVASIQSYVYTTMYSWQSTSMVSTIREVYLKLGG